MRSYVPDRVSEGQVVGERLLSSAFQVVHTWLTHREYAEGNRSEGRDYRMRG